MCIVPVKDKNMLREHIRSLMVFTFLNEYIQLEFVIRKVFEVNIDTLPPNILQQLYFYYGGKISTYIEYESHGVKVKELKYNEKEQFKDFSIIQIIKVFKKNNCLKAFNFSIDSIRNSIKSISFYDCIIRLINMRNILAHELTNLTFNEKDIVEMLSINQISEESFNLLKNYDLSIMDDTTQCIASNIVYIRKLILKLDSGNNFS